MISDRFGAVLAVRAAHRRDVAVDAAQHLAHRAGIPLTLFALIDRDQATLIPTSGPHTVADLAAAIKSRSGALLVLDALGGGPDADRLYDSDAEHLLVNVPLPTLVFGPHATLDATRPILLVAADGGGAAGTASVPTAVAWTATFASAAVVVGLDVPDSWPTEDADPAVDPPRQLAAALANAGVTVDLERRRTLDPVGALIEAAAEVPGGVLVIPAARFPTAVNHWFSTSRRLIRHAPRPVLLAPEPPR